MVIVGAGSGALPGLVVGLGAATQVLGLRGAPGDRRRAACRDRARGTPGRLAMTALPRQPALAADRWSLRRDGPDWVLEAGPERARLRDTRGLHHLAALLTAPGTEIPALDLAAGGRPGLAASGAEPVLDPAALGAYRRRIRQLDADLAAADRAGDPAAAEKAHAERQALVGELRRATGLAGRPRRTPAEAERARVNVTRTLRAAIAAIAAAAPLAGGHLHASIRTGTACRYQPAPGGPARWHT